MSLSYAPFDAMFCDIQLDSVPSWDFSAALLEYMSTLKKRLVATQLALADIKALLKAKLLKVLYSNTRSSSSPNGGAL
jgi:hypothetical protein